ncbi:MAG: amidohydrolase [Williamsia sp.]|nr:amidohydrolase [Williamsia sp.]
MKRIYDFAGTFLLCILVSVQGLQAQTGKADVTALKKRALTELDKGKDGYQKIAMQIWDYAEVGYKEYKSTALLQKELQRNGFKIDTGVAEIPTAFVATYGQGKPVIGILAEFDALPGLAQDTVPDKKVLAGRPAGHGCGHHLLGTAGVEAAIQLKKMLEQQELSGTVKVYGTPAEEGGSGKVYMVRAGLFKGVDVVLHWHPGSDNSVMGASSLANISAKFRFYGLSAHAAGAPDKGRSALDAVEAMDYMVNMMREHVPSDTRIHYVITDGGKAPNVVPDFAESYYYVRNPANENVQQIFDRITKAGDGAALGTGTKMQYEITGGTYGLLINKTLAEAMQKNLEMAGGVEYNAKEIQFAQKLQTSFAYAVPSVESVKTVSPLDATHGINGSTDVGDVSWNVPTVGMSAATWVAGTPAHSWQAVAGGGTSIGIKGMQVAAKCLTLTAIDLFTDGALRDKALEEFNRSRGTKFEYKALLGDRKPALHYRD